MTINRMILLLLMMVMLGAVGCRTSGPVAESSQASTVDSTKVTVRERQVPVRVPGVSFDTYIEIACDPVTNLPAIANRGSDGWSFPIFDTGSLPGWFHGSGKPPGKLGAELEDGRRLKISFVSDSLTHLIQVRDSVINRYRSETTQSRATAYVRDIRWYDRVSHWVAGLVLAYGIFVSGKYIYKLKRVIT